jgi:uncharacterized protein YjiS (DUF1127 family)
MKGQRGFVQVFPEAYRPETGATVAGGLLARLIRWRELARQRRQLAALSDSALHDLGLSRADVAAEAERPFWDNPLGKVR